MELFKLYGSVFVETSDAQRKISSITEKAKDFGGKMGNAMKSTAGVIAGVAGVATAVGAAMFSMAKETAMRLDTIDKQARNMGVTNEWYQQWDYIAKICGTDMAKISNAVETMSKKVGDASDDTVQALGQLGISMIDAKDMAPQDLFETVVTRLAEIEDPATKASLASKLLGGSWKELGTVMSSSATDIQNMKDRFGELGAMMSDEDVAKGAAFSDALTDLDTAVTGLKNSIGVELIPVVQPLIEQLTNAVVWISGHVPAAFDAIRDAVNGLISAAQRIGGVFGGSSGGSMGKISTGSGKFASGLDYTPYNNYPALLHRGEAVVPAGTASTGGGGMTVTQVFQNRPQTEAERAETLQRMLQEMRWAE